MLSCGWETQLVAPSGSPWLRTQWTLWTQWISWLILWLTWLHRKWWRNESSTGYDPRIIAKRPMISFSVSHRKWSNDIQWSFKNWILKLPYSRLTWKRCSFESPQAPHKSFICPSDVYTLPANTLEKWYGSISVVTPYTWVCGLILWGMP